MPTQPPLGFDSNEYTSEGEFYRSNSPEQLRLDEKRNYALRKHKRQPDRNVYGEYRRHTGA